MWMREKLQQKNQRLLVFVFMCLYGAKELLLARCTAQCANDGYVQEFLVVKSKAD